VCSTKLGYTFQDPLILQRCSIWFNTVFFINSACHAHFSFFLLDLAKSGGCIDSHCYNHSSRICFCIQLLSSNTQFNYLQAGKLEKAASIHKLSIQYRKASIFGCIRCCFRSTSCIYNIWQESSVMQQVL